ncbi:hypothetical protein PHLCEN_2v3625 [Hermanssonia centrifuga]|uniref:Uncharacterized protein n=1 Tax=Hermanssonia centrifuga TaxID=98765 RepID=A0A2R6QEK6_9APHY|nr:hypothetical protein PHLCEN_2v3625 [Hermanssonia centrifuga]
MPYSFQAIYYVTKYPEEHNNDLNDLLNSACINIGAFCRPIFGRVAGVKVANDLD